MRVRVDFKLARYNRFHLVAVVMKFQKVSYIILITRINSIQILSVYILYTYNKNKLKL